MEKFEPNSITESHERLPDSELILPAKQKIIQMAEQIQSAGGPTLADYLSNPENLERLKFKKIVVAGPPRSGKSCFNTGIKG